MDRQPATSYTIVGWDGVWMNSYRVDFLAPLARLELRVYRVLPAGTAAAAAGPLSVRAAGAPARLVPLGAIAVPLDLMAKRWS